MYLAWAGVSVASALVWGHLCPFDGVRTAAREAVAGIAKWGQSALSGMAISPDDSMHPGAWGPRPDEVPGP